MPATRVVVNISGQTAYDVRIGTGILDGLGSYLRNKVVATAQASTVLVITDSTVAPLYLPRVKQSLKAVGFRSYDISVPTGETSKNIEIVSEIWEAMAHLKLERDCVVVALGGGVIGDMAGFVAATYMRGVQFVQVPTTLLAMVDASVGGKTGIDLSAGKNLVGAFKQPAYVCADTEVLATLDERQWICGLAEVAKSAVIDSDEFFFWLLDHAEELKAREASVVAEAIARCVVFKADVVAADQREEQGIRECLNYGHTYGHALEQLSGYGTYSHGEAVAEGMRFALRMAVDLVGASPELVEAQDDLLDQLGLARLGWMGDPDAVLQCMKCDKKARGGDVRFVLPKDVGQWELVPVDDQTILTYLRTWFEGGQS